MKKVAIILMTTIINKKKWKWVAQIIIFLIRIIKLIIKTIILTIIILFGIKPCTSLSLHKTLKCVNLTVNINNNKIIIILKIIISQIKTK